MMQRIQNAANRSHPKKLHFLRGHGKYGFSSLATTDTTLPEKAHVIVIGGGIIGTSVAYHLAKLGVEDILLLERDRLTSGTTWHAAGLINTFGSMSQTSTWMRQYTKDLYKNILPDETGFSTGWKEIGFIELACDPDRLEAYRRTAAFNRFCGVNVEEISPNEVKERFPLCDATSVLAGFFVESDGRANPTDATMALARGARQNGVKIMEGVMVSGVETTIQSDGFVPAVSAVTLANGTSIQAEKVVNCTGMWARQFAQACGVHSIPNQAAEHYYLITEPIDGVDPTWPVIEDASRYVYVRPEGQGLMLGLFEAKGEPWKGGGIPNDFNFGEIEPDWDRMAPYIKKAVELVPAVNNVGIKKLFCGPESFTPDSAPIVGESKELRNYYVACGLNSLGILTGGGVGNILARWVRDGVAPNDVDVTGIDAVRFHRYQNNRQYRERRAGEALGNTYANHFPNHQPKTCRNTKQSALHDCLKDRNAYFKDVSGWESPMWYAPKGVLPVVEQESFGRENWFDYWAAEHNSCRNDVALFDMSFMTKVLVAGNDAGKFLNRLSTANVNGPSCRITYTQWLTEKGFMAADLTVMKLDEKQFMVVATDNMHNQVIDHMQKRLKSTDHVFLTDVTARYAQINVQGPKSRNLLQSLTDVDLQSLAFRDVEEIDMGLGRAICARITYIGELGYELFVPIEQARQVYHQIIQAGDTHNLRHAGLKALGSLRLEKGYRDYGHDMDNADTLLECGLAFTCDMNKEDSFIGQESVMKQRAQAKLDGGLKRKMASVLCLNKDVMLHHGEILWKDGHRIADIRAASYGHTLGGSVGLTMLQSADPINESYVQGGNWEVEVGNEFYPCEVSLKPFYDPKNLRIRD